MKSTAKSRKSTSVWPVIRTYWVHILFIFFLVNFVIVRTLELEFFASNCITRSQMQSDSRCLYSYNGNVYEKGSRNRPHHGHSCGSDVTTVMPSGHVRNMARYLDPTLVGSVCTDNPAATNTPSPTAVSTRTPTPTQRPANTPSPSQRPANTPTPTSARQTTLTPTPTRSQSSGILTQTPIKQSVQATVTNKVAFMTPSPTKKTSILATPTNTPYIVQAANSNTSIGKFGSGNQLAQLADSIMPQEPEPPLTPENTLEKPVDPTTGDIGQKIIMWSEILVVVSFLLLIVTIVVGVYKRLRTHL